MPLEKEKCSVGMKVQDANANVGVIRWIGRMEKNQKPPNKDVGTYCAVEFSTPNQAYHRTDGTWEGQRYCEAPAGTVEFMKPKMLELEMNSAGIKQIREKFGDKIKDWSDTKVIKFLVARKYKIPDVVIMIENHLKWRAEFQPTEDEYFPPEMGNDYPVGYSDGLDREGNLIYFERPGNAGKCHPKDFIKKYEIPRICRWHTANMEYGTNLLARHPTAQRVTSIIDLSNLGDSDRKVITFGKAIAKIDQDNYPEHLCKMYIINAPTVFTGLWRMIRVFVDDRTKTKIHVLGKDWKETVEKQIDPKYLPSFMGGTDDSWLKNGGRAGCNDPSKARDPNSGAQIEIDDNVTDEQLAAEAAKSATPTAK